MPGNVDLGRINSLPLLKTGGCAQIVGRHSDLLATAREARLASDAREEAQAEALSLRFRPRWRFAFLRAAR